MTEAAMMTGHSPRLRGVIFVLAISLLVAIVSPFTLDRTAETSLERSLNRTLITFATARGLNAVVSIAQGTEFSVEPLGMGVTLTPGEILDPVNDLVEKLSDLLMISVISLGTQQILIEILTSVTVTVIFVLTVALWALVSLAKVPSLSRFRSLAARLCWIAFLLRAGIPLLAWSTEVVHQAFLMQKYENASAEISSAATKVEQTNSLTGPGESTVERVGGAFGLLTSPLESIRAKIEQYKTIASDAVRHILDLVIIFAFETIVVPIFILWLLRTVLVGILAKI